MKLKPITVTLVMLLIVFSISIIYFNVKKMNERFLVPDVPEYDPNQIDENCINYIGDIKNWKLDFGLPEGTNDTERRLREEKIKRRSEIISLFTTMKSPVYSIFGQQYFYSDACVIPKNNMTVINMPDDTCKLEGNFIKESDITETVIGIEQSEDYKNKYGSAGIEYLEEYKKKYIVPDKIKIYTPDLFRNITSLNENDMKPNKGCIIPTRTPEEFFNFIDRIAAMRYFNDDNNTRLIEEARIVDIKNKLVAVVDKDRAIIARDIAIAQRIAAEQERDRVIIERDAALAKIVILEADIVKLNATIIQLNNNIAQLQNTIVDRDNTIIAKQNDIDKLIAEKQDEITAKNKAIDEMRALVVKYNNVDNKLREIIAQLVVVPTFYRGKNYTGESTTFNLTPKDVKKLLPGLGDYGWNDAIASVMVPPGYRVNLFDNANFKGKKYVLNGSKAEFPKSFRRRAGSIRIEKTKNNASDDMPPKVTVDPLSDLKTKYNF